MTLLFVDGFDHYASADLTKKYNVSNSATISSSGGRRSGGGYVGGKYHYTSKVFSSSSASTVFGFAVKLVSDSSTTGMVSILEGSTVHLTLSFAATTSGKIRITRGDSGGTLLNTSTATLSIGVWYYIEFKSTIHDTTGSYELRINGASDVSGSSVDTRNGGTSGVIDTIQLGSFATIGTPASYDDLYFCNQSGATNNNFLGDCRVDTLLPTGDGNYLQFTPSTGTTHYTLVDESTPNTTDYVSDANAGDRDSYTFPDLTALTSQTVYGIQINAAALKSDTGTRSIGTMSRLSGTDKDGTGVALGTGQSYISEIQETDPASAAWTEANINAAEFGVKVTV